MSYRSLLFMALITLLGACSNDPDDTDTPDETGGPLSLENAFPSLSFNRPVLITDAGDGSGMIYVLQQVGVVDIFENDPNASSSSIFIDISDRMSTGGERGLLGLAFHPEYANNHLFYLNYINIDGSTVISEFTANADNSAGDSSTERVLMTIEQPFTNHNAGMIDFGPDGYLYIATGDGGSAGDPLNQSQDRTTLLGNILRIDVDAGEPYAIPGTNPFAGNTENFREEIYAYGLRNPWRFSFDSETGDLWAADVGQNEIEEVDLIVAGGNYGWKIMEGESCFEAATCEMDQLILPVTQYTHDLGSSITGGYVYRGDELSDLVGHYFYGDFTSGRIWSFNTSESVADPQLRFETSMNISSFGTDEEGTLYVIDYSAGQIFKVVRTED